MRRPQFSVIIPTLNEEKFLPNLLTSLALQSVKPFEVIVVDGKSTDATVSVANSFRKTLPLRVIACDRANLPMQRNRGAREARWEWLVFVDADSVLLPYFFERVERFIDDQRPQFFTAWFRPDSEQPSDVLFTLLANVYVEGALLVKRPISPGPMTVVHRDAFARVGGYDESVRWGEDYDLTKRVTAAGFALRVVRETLYVHSLRRLRAEGKLKMLRVYTQAAILALVTGKTFQRVSDYVMGGHLYSRRRKPVKPSVVTVYERKLKTLMKELFS